MSFGEELSAAPVPLRYLVSFNPRPTSDFDGDAVYLPMEAISEFGAVDTSRRRPFGDLRQGYSYVADGDVAFAKVTPCFENGKGFVARSLPDGHAFATTEVSVLRPSSRIDVDYLGWALQSSHFLKQGESHMTGSGGLRRVPDSFVGSYAVPLPGRRVQRAIADYLDRETARIDTLIEEQQRLIRMLGERRAAVIADAVTKGVGQGAVWTKPDAGPLWEVLPDGWQSGQVKHAATVTLGKMLQSKDSGGDVLAPYMRAANVQPDGVLAIDDVNEMWFRETELKQLSIKAGDVVVVEGGQGGFGRAAFIEEGLPGWGFQNSINRLRPIGDFDGRFIASYLIALRASGFMRAYANVVSMPHLTAEKLARIPMPLPPMKEQRAIADYLDEETVKIDALIAEGERFIDLSRERRSALITAAVTGQIDVREMV